MRPKHLKPGMPCPACSTFIKFSISQLSSGSGIRCGGCGLVLVLDKSAAQRAMDLCQELRDAMKSVAVM